MTTSTSANIITLNTAKHVFPAETTENTALGTNREAIGKRLGDTLAQLNASQAEQNSACLAHIQTLLCSTEVAKMLLSTIKEQNGDLNRYTTGIDAMLSYFDADEPVKVTELCKQSAATNSLLTEDFQLRKIKPLLETLGILIKNTDNSFKWIDLKSLETRCTTPSECTTDVQSTPAAVQRTRFSVQSLRQWQRNYYLKKAKANPWLKLHSDGSVEELNKPFEGELTEKEKELIRKAAYVEVEGKLKSIIANAGNKELQHHLKAAELELEQQTLAIKKEAALRVANLEAQRLETYARLATFKPLLIGLIVLAAIAFFMQSNNGAPIADPYATLPEPQPIWEAGQ